MSWTCAHPILALLATLATLGPLAPPVYAFDLIDLPPAGRRTLNLNLGDTPWETRGYGVTSWNQLAQEAMNRWNDAGIGSFPDHAFFEVKTPAGEGNPCRRDGTSEVRWAPTLCGWSWGGVLGVTISWIVGGKTVETDVILNGPANRDAYPGRLEPTVDFFRVILHEFGHAAGLDHPDGAGQNVVALMNGTISNVDGIQADDRAGARAVLWDPGPAGRMENFVRALYTEVLERTPSAAEVKAWVTALLASSPGSDPMARLVHAFMQSDEGLSHPRTLADHVRVLYRTLFDRAPADEETVAWVGILAERYNTLLPGFVNSPEFEALGARTAPGVIVQRFYREVLGRSGAEAEVQAWVATVSATGDWQTVARGFLNSSEYLATPRTLTQHVAVLYRTFLGRTPDAAEASAWVHFLNAQLAVSHDAFVNSGEFRQRTQSFFR